MAGGAFGKMQIELFLLIKNYNCRNYIRWKDKLFNERSEEEGKIRKVNKITLRKICLDKIISFDSPKRILFARSTKKLFPYPDISARMYTYKRIQFMLT